jgi:hypothetical protein
MRRILVAIALLAVCCPLVVGQEDEAFSGEQLDNLLAPIALYPDPLLAQVLLAATFPDQIDEASRFLRGAADPNYIDSQPWDVSVKAVARYPTVLDMMADKLDWTTAVGQAYVNQSTAVTESVQRLRAEARAAGNLVSTPQQEVAVSGGYIEIYPAQPRFIYVPVYDPEVVYFRRPGFFAGAVISFGRGFAIGAWLNHDFDWGSHRVYYHGWDRGPVWVRRSRPFVHVTNVYVNNNYHTVHMNRMVVHRRLDYGNLDRYRAVHRTITYGNVRRGHPEPRNRVVITNKVIQRNVVVDRSRMDTFRGRGGQVQRRDNPVFGGDRSGFGARRESQRGQASRQQMRQPERGGRPDRGARPQQAAPQKPAARQDTRKREGRQR